MWVVGAEHHVRMGRRAGARDDVARAESLAGGPAAFAATAAALDFLDGREDQAIARLRATAAPGAADAALRTVLAQQLLFLGFANAAERAR